MLISYFYNRFEYCQGNGFELLSVFFLLLYAKTQSLSDTLLSFLNKVHVVKSMEWLFNQVQSAMLEPLACFLRLRKCLSFQFENIYLSHQCSFRNSPSKEIYKQHLFDILKAVSIWGGLKLLLKRFKRFADYEDIVVFV